MIQHNIFLLMVVQHWVDLISLERVNAMSYSRKYAFLNLLNLKTGIKDEDGYEAKPFEQNSAEQSVEEPTYMDETIDVEDIKDELKNAKTIKDFKSC